MSTAKAMDNARYGATGEDESRLYNELEISVLRATSLPLGLDDTAPTAYVHFQFLGKSLPFLSDYHLRICPRFSVRAWCKPSYPLTPLPLLVFLIHHHNITPMTDD